MEPLTYELFSTQEELVDDVVSNLAPQHGLIIGRPFSKIIEENLDNVEVHYLVMNAADTPVALVYFVEFSLEIFSTKLKIVICGSPFFCSDCGINVNIQQSRSDLVPHILKVLQGVFIERSISAVIIKDIDVPHQALSQAGYYVIPVEPVMAIRQVDRWNRFEDYLTDLKPKYKRKIRNAKEKLAEEGYAIEKESDMLNDIGRLYELYRIVANRKPDSLNGDFKIENIPFSQMAYNHP